MWNVKIRDFFYSRNMLCILGERRESFCTITGPGGGGSRYYTDVCGWKIGRKQQFEVSKSFSLCSYLFSVSGITSSWGRGVGW